MQSATIILKDAKQDIEHAIRILNQAVRVIQVLDNNGYADSQLADFFMRASMDLVESMQKKASETKAKVHKAEIMRELAVFNGQLAGTCNRLSRGY